MSFYQITKEKLLEKLRANLLILQKGMSKESDLTSSMIRTYIKSTRGQASKEEMKIANKQFRSFLKTLGVGTLVILPFAPLTLPAVVLLGKKLGIDVIPDSFRDDGER